MKSITKQAICTILAALFTLASILPAGAEEMPQTQEESPAFEAQVTWSGGNGYIVMGTFTKFTAGITNIQPMYSLDGQSYLPCEDIDWELQYNPKDAGELQKLQNQICLFSNMEPLKSYLDGTLDRFYLKLCITNENGINYETQAAVIDRGTVQPLPEEISAGLMFSSSMLVRKTDPFRFCGRYQITVSENSSPEEIASYLPDTVPVTVALQKDNRQFTECIIDCPVTWKPVGFASLTPGENVTIEDAAEPVIVPAGTQLRTPLGTFCLDEALDFSEPYVSDEIDLVLNVVEGDTAPSGALSAERDGLELAFDLKPTGASAIWVYTCTAYDTEWTQLPGSFPLDAIADQPSTQNSGYALILDNNTEPYRSYLAQKETGDPAPFFVGVKIEGGVYDGKTLILPWPANYDLPLDLPKPGGSGGNENNAGSGDKNDSTDEGQRPDLPDDTSGSAGASGSTGASGSSGSAGASGSSEPADSQPSEPDEGTQTKPETPDMTTPDPSEPQLPDMTTPDPSGSQPTDHPKPVRPFEQQTAQDAAQNAPENEAAFRTNTKTGTIRTTVKGGRTYASENSVTGSQAHTAETSVADDKARTAETPAADKSAHASETSTADKSAPVNDSLSPADKTPTVQNDRAKTDAALPQQTPERDNKSKGSHPVLPAAAAAACFAACIAAVRKTPRR